LSATRQSASRFLKRFQSVGYFFVIEERLTEMDANPKKAEQVARLKELLERFSAIIAVNYAGMRVIQLQAMRKRLRDADATVLVARNTLMAIAADQAGQPGLKELLGGQLAFIFVASDGAAPVAKALLSAIKDEDLSAEVIGGVLDGAVMNRAQIERLSKLPPRDALVAQLLGLFNAPARNLATSLNGIIGGFAVALGAVAKQKQAAESK